MIGCEMECYTFGANIKIASLKGSDFSWKSYAKGSILIESHPIIHLMMSVGLKFVFNHLPAHYTFTYVQIES